MTIKQDRINEMTAKAKAIHNTLIVPILGLTKLQSDLGSNPMDHANDMRDDADSISQRMAELMSIDAKELELAEGTFNGAAELIVDGTHDLLRTVLNTQDQLTKLDAVIGEQVSRVQHASKPIFDSYDQYLRQNLIAAGANPEAFQRNKTFARDLAERFLGYEIDAQDHGQAMVRVVFQTGVVHIGNPDFETVIQKLVRLGIDEATLREIAKILWTSGAGVDTTLPLENIIALSMLLAAD